jgi:hypothetical protein
MIGKRGKLFAVAGPGPSLSGQNPYAAPHALTVDSGITDWRGSLLCSQGLIYRSERGLYLMPRGLGPPDWLGKFARDVLKDFPVITGAALVPARNLAIWTCNDTDGLTGRALVLDYARGAWSTWKMSDGYSLSGVTVIDDVIRFSSARLEGTVYTEQDVAYDGIEATQVTSTLETQHIAPSGHVNGYTRTWSVRLRGELRDANGCKLTIYAQVDDDDAYNYSQWWDIKGAAGMKFEREWVLPWQNLEALKLKIVDGYVTPAPLALTTPTAGVALNAITLDVAVKASQKPLQEGYRG